MDTGRLLPREQADEVEDEFALRVQDDCEVSVLTLSHFFGELDVELWRFLFCHCLFVSMLSLVETEGLSWDSSFHQRYTKAPNLGVKHEPLPPSSLAPTRARSTSGLAEGQKTTYRRSSLKPTVGRLTDLR